MMDELSRLVRTALDQFMQTKIFCATENCRFNRSSGGCAFRDVLILDGKCSSFEPSAEEKGA